MFEADVAITNTLDSNGNPTGGGAYGVGIHIDWQSGPLVIDGQSFPQNGAFVQTLLEIVKQRLEFFQTASDGRFRCAENDAVIFKITESIRLLKSRHNRRGAQGAAGTHDAVAGDGSGV